MNSCLAYRGEYGSYVSSDEGHIHATRFDDVWAQLATEEAGPKMLEMATMMRKTAPCAT